MLALCVCCKMYVRIRPGIYVGPCCADTRRTAFLAECFFIRFRARSTGSGRSNSVRPIKKRGFLLSAALSRGLERHNSLCIGLVGRTRRAFGGARAVCTIKGPVASGCRGGDVGQGEEGIDGCGYLAAELLSSRRVSDTGCIGQRAVRWILRWMAASADCTIRRP